MRKPPSKGDEARTIRLALLGGKYGNWADEGIQDEIVDSNKTASACNWRSGVRPKIDAFAADAATITSAVEFGANTGSKALAASLAVVPH